MIRAVRQLNLPWLRRHPLRTALAAVAVVAGTSLVLSVLIVGQSVTASIAGYSRSVAGPAPLRVIGAQSAGGIEQSVVARVAATPGVSYAVPLVQAVTLVQRRATITAPRLVVVALGVDCRVQSLVGRFGCDPRLLDSSGMLISDLVRPGDQLLTGAGTVPLTGSLVLPGLDRLNHGRVVVMPLARAQALFSRPGRVDVVYVGARPGVSVSALGERLKGVVGPQNAVLRGSDPPPQVAAATATLLSLFALMAILAAGISGVLVYNVVSLSLEERRRHNALVAAVGAPPSALVLGPLLEAGVIGAIGGLVGAAAGLVVAGPIARTLSDFTQGAVGVPVSLHAGPLTFLVGLVFGVLLAVLAAARPVRRSLRLDVTAELSGRDLPAEAAPRARVRRLALLLTVVAASVFGCWISQTHGALERWQPTVGQLSFLALTLSTVLACGAAAPFLVRAARPWAERRGPLTRLGLANLARNPGRTGVMAVALAATIGVAFITGSFSRSVHDSVAHAIAVSDPDGVVVHGPESGQGVSGGFPPGVEARLAALPGVARIDRSAGVLTGQTAANSAGVVGTDHLFAGVGVLQGRASPSAFSRGEVLVGPGLARTQGLRAGSLVTLDAPGGPVRLPVQGVWADGDWSGNNATVPLDLFQRIWGPVPVGSVEITPAPGVSADQLAARVRNAGIWSDLAVRTPAQSVAQNTRAVNGQIQPFWVLQRAMTLVAFVAVLSTLLLAGIQRRREMGLLAAVGLRPEDLGGLVLAEGGLVAAVGIVLGAAFGLLGLYGMFQVLPNVLGYRDPFRMDVVSFVLYAAAAVVVVLAASALPSWRARRLPILEALQYE